MAEPNNDAISSPLSDDGIKAKVREIQEQLNEQENRARHCTRSAVDRHNQATISDLRLQIAMYESILERRAYSRQSRQPESLGIEAR